MSNEELSIELSEEVLRNLEQNALLHSVLLDIGESLGWSFSGQPVDIDDLKSIFMCAYRKAAAENCAEIIWLNSVLLCPPAKTA